MCSWRENTLTHLGAAIKRLLILDTPEHVDSENIKLKICPCFTNFIQNVIFTS
jgi:hypothetical protein